MTFPMLSDVQRLAMLEPRGGRVDVVLDTDTYNEIDDQFAVVYAVLASDTIRLRAICAAPFLNARSKDPGDGMQRSFEEIGRLIERLPGRAPETIAKGATQFMTGANRAEMSEAVEAVVNAAADHDGENPLYVLSIGAPTNVSSAIVAHPDLAERIVVVWLGGHAPWWPDTAEFNYRQDIHATRVLFDSGISLVQIPCMGVASHLITTIPEIDLHVAERGAIGSYLARIYRSFYEEHPSGSKVIWDIATVAYLRNSAWTRSTLAHSPIVNPSMTYGSDPTRHLIKQIFGLDRDAILQDLYSLLPA